MIYLDIKLIDNIISQIEFQTPKFSTLNSVLDILINTINNKKKILVYGDYDADGAMSALILAMAFDKIGFKNYDIFQYRERTHKLDKTCVKQYARSDYDLLIVTDTGSSAEDLKSLEPVNKLKKDAIVLDHHVTELSYDDFPNNMYVINTTIENRIIGNEYYKLSAGALSFCVVHKLLEIYGVDGADLSTLALTSLYADCMDMGSELNRAIYWKAMSVEQKNIPSILCMFLNDYTVFGRRYIEYWFAPRINAAFRSETYTLLNKFLFSKDLNAVEMSNIILMMNTMYESIRELSGKIAENVNVHEMGNFIISDLSSSGIDVLSNKIYNYTGLVANKLSDKYGKAAVVYCSTYSDIKGSVRSNNSGTDYLNIFKQFCEAEGHKSAFGFKIKPFGINRFVEIVKTLDKHLTKDVLRNKYTNIINMELHNPDTTLLNKIALYNDFEGDSLETAYVTKEFNDSIRNTYSKYGYKYKWGNVTITSRFSIRSGCKVILKPVIRKYLTLEVEGVL